MESHQVLREAIDEIGVKRVAKDLNVSTSLVYKWCSEDVSGARNPLDRLAALVKTTQDTRPVQWLCHQAGGFFVADPEAKLQDFGQEYLAHTQKMLSKFSQLLRVISDSIQNDDRVDTKESQHIRDEWERLKGYTETFVVACEKGVFDA